MLYIVCSAELPLMCTFRTNKATVSFRPGEKTLLCSVVLRSVEVVPS